MRTRAAARGTAARGTAAAPKRLPDALLPERPTTARPARALELRSAVRHTVRHTRALRATPARWRLGGGCSAAARWLLGGCSAAARQYSIGGFSAAEPARACTRGMWGLRPGRVHAHQERLEREVRPPAAALQACWPGVAGRGLRLYPNQGSSARRLTRRELRGQRGAKERRRKAARLPQGAREVSRQGSRLVYLCYHALPELRDGSRAFHLPFPCARHATICPKEQHCSSVDAMRNPAQQCLRAWGGRTRSTHAGAQSFSHRRGAGCATSWRNI